MKISEAWLREWVDPSIGIDELTAQLTNAGLEVDGVEPVAGKIDAVVVAEVHAVGKHPDAERLALCEVGIGTEERFAVVCGAPNVSAGMRTAFAPVGARIGDGTKIRKAKIRGVASQGMLCSARELGLGDAHEGILELPADAPVGANFVDYMALDDNAIEIDLTPNRGECLGIAGIAREVGAINRCEVRAPEIPLIKSTIPDRFPIALEAANDCPRYVGRIVRGIDPKAQTPAWMVERLRRCGLRSISPVVDVTNYVMLELGQPMHAFDFNKLEGGIRVRKAREGETLVLLDEREVSLQPTTLVIADERQAVALAGIMGGLDSGVSASTEDIFLESAFFSPLGLIGQARQYGLHTDASHRFERGVDPELQRRAAERATQLLIDIVGGEPGPIVDEVSAVHMPRRAELTLREQRLARLLGMAVDPDTVTDALERLGMVVQRVAEGWKVTPPSYRFDISIEADLIEEVARMVGYDAVPAVGLGPGASAPNVQEADVPLHSMRRALVDLGYQEAVTYSFVDTAMHALVVPDEDPIALANPISSELAVMRTSLWPGLLHALIHNTNRQQERVRLFETGLVFRAGVEDEAPGAFRQVGQLTQTPCLGAVVAGPALPEQWGERSRPVDFYDVKADVERLLELARGSGGFDYQPGEDPALHSGQCAIITCQGRAVGRLGALAPRVRQALKLTLPVFLFQIELAALRAGQVPSYAEVSKFPAVRRDISVLIDETVSAQVIRSAVGQVSPDVLKNLEFFDVYRGEGIDPGTKSISLGLTFQAVSRTLQDSEIDGFVATIVRRLRDDLGAILRG